MVTLHSFILMAPSLTNRIYLGHMHLMLCSCHSCPQDDTKPQSKNETSLTMSEALPWRYRDPFYERWNIETHNIDHYGHVNNQAYLARLESLAWAHTNALGLSFSDYQQLDRAMVIRRHELDYHLACHHGDTLHCATWITACDKRLSLTREFQFICERRLKTVFSAKTEFVCTALSTGKPKRLPAKFIEVYGGACTT